MAKGRGEVHPALFLFLDKNGSFLEVSLKEDCVARDLPLERKIGKSVQSRFSIENDGKIWAAMAYVEFLSGKP